MFKDPDNHSCERMKIQQDHAESVGLDFRSIEELFDFHRNLSQDALTNLKEHVEHFLGLGAMDWLIDFSLL